MLGIIIGAGGMRFAVEHGIIDLNLSTIQNSNSLNSLLATSDNEEKDSEKLLLGIDRLADQLHLQDDQLTTLEKVLTERSISIKQEDYCELQELLREHGAYNGPIDGIFGKKSVKAVRDAQKHFELEETGKATGGLLSLLSAEAPNVDKDVSNIYPNPRNPANSTILLRGKRSRVAPLKVITSEGHGDYAVKLTNTRTGNDELLFFIRGGRTAKINVPLGSYSMKYAVGSTWLSNRCLFGRQTSHYKADEIFHFSSNGHRVSGYTVELILQSNGNLRTEEISKDRW